MLYSIAQNYTIGNKKMLLSKHEEYMTVRLVRRTDGQVMSSVIRRKPYTDNGPDKGFQQAERNGINRNNDGQYVQIKSNNPHQYKRRKPTDERCLHQFEFP